MQGKRQANSASPHRLNTGMISLLLTVLILLLVFGLIGWAVSLLPLPAPFGQVAYAVLAIILILILLGWFLPGIEHPVVLR